MVDDKKNYRWLCKCGQHGFVDISEDNPENPFPCSSCFAKILKKRKSKNKIEPIFKEKQNGQAD